MKRADLILDDTPAITSLDQQSTRSMTKVQLYVIDVTPIRESRFSARVEVRGRSSV